MISRFIRAASCLIVIFSGRAAAADIRGNRHLSDERIMEAISNVNSSDSVIARIEEVYRREGFFLAKVQWISSTAKGEREISISEGKASMVDSLTVTLQPPVSTMIFEDLVDELVGKIASEANLNGFAERCIERLAESGMPYASGEWSSFGLDDHNGVIAEFMILPGPFVYVKGIRFAGIRRTRPQTLRRLIRIKDGARYSEGEIEDAERQLELMPYVDLGGPFEIVPAADADSCIIVFRVRETPSTRFDGGGGLVRSGRHSTFLGRADLEFGDILGTGRAFGLVWNRKDKYSAELRLRYFEPFFLNGPFDMELGAFQLDRDTTFIQTGATLGLTHMFEGGLSASLAFTVQRTEPETGSDVISSVGRSVKLTFDFDRTDYLENPSTGYGISSEVDYKSRSNSGADSLNLPSILTSAGMEIRKFLKIARHFIIAGRLSGWGIVSSDGNTPIDELAFLGGFESLRGYSERRFPALRYFTATIEPRLIAGRQSRLYIFTDMAEIKSGETEKYRFFPGFGVGVVAPTTLGQFRLEVAWGRTGFPSDAVVNLGVAGKF
jgi:outer membrane protein assembly factor BamA